MTSGIYKLTFSNGSFYIGKSINIEERWIQHMNKFCKHSAARLMQQAFDAYGPPRGTIVFECHPDHIDLVEASFINRLKPDLNGTYPPCPFSAYGGDEYDALVSWLNMSTVEHITKLQLYSLEKNEIKKLNKYIEFLEADRTREEVLVDVNNELTQLRASNKYLNEEIDRIKIEQYTKLPWYKRIFLEHKSYKYGSCGPVWLQCIMYMYLPYGFWLIFQQIAKL